MTTEPPRGSAPVSQPLPPADAHEYDDEIDLGELVGVLAEHKWLIGGIAALALAFGVFYALWVQPVYQADALLQVEQPQGSGLGLEELSTLTGDEPPAETEIQILRSRYVVGPVVERLNLDIHAEPRSFPVLGQWARRRAEGDAPAPPWFGLDAYGWGGEAIRVKQLVVPEALRGEPLTLTALGDDRFRLDDPEGRTLLTGAVGVPAGEGELGIFVAELVARPGTQFQVVKRPWLKAVGGLQERLAVAEQGKGTGIIRVSLEGEDKPQIAQILDVLTTTYLRQNVERRSAEAAESLEFLEEQLPTLKRDLEAAEQALNAFRQQNRSLDLTVETEGLLEQIVEIESQLAELQLKRAALAQNYAAQHPAMQAIGSQLAELRGVQRQLQGRVEELPDTQQEILRLQREVQVQTELYMGLLNQAQELRVIKAGTVGNVRILDRPVVPIEPVKPRKSLIAALSLFLGLFLGVLLVFLRRALRRTLRSPDEIERALGLSVYAVVPHSRVQPKLFETARRRRRRNLPEQRKMAVAALRVPDDPLVESLRSLRTSLHFALLEQQSNLICISSPSPNSGKTTISTNLAVLLSQMQQRVLLIDADMRRGEVHSYLGRARAPGLADVLGGTATFAEAHVAVLEDSLHVLTAGTVPPNPAELLMSGAFDALLAEAHRHYDTVLIDTPPILAVTDAGIVGAKAGATFLVAREEHAHLAELEQAVKRLVHNGVRVTGVIYNDHRPRTRAGAYGGYYYYDYRPKHAAGT